jgi:hypothetical protein
MTLTCVCVCVCVTNRNSLCLIGAPQVFLVAAKSDEIYGMRAPCIAYHPFIRYISNPQCGVRS